MVFTGGMARSKMLIGMIRKYAGFVAPFLVYPEMEEMIALATSVQAAMAREKSRSRSIVEMSRIEIAAEMCKACELCIVGLPEGLHRACRHAEPLRRVSRCGCGRARECTGCTLCATMCPDTAIEVYRTVVEKPPGSGGRGNHCRHTEPATAATGRRPQHEQGIDERQRRRGRGRDPGGLDCYFGYPITPQNEIIAGMAARLPPLGRVFLQSESELAAISMVHGAAAAGKRAMTTSSSPGVSLMQEGISYLSGCQRAGGDRQRAARRSGAGQHRRGPGRLFPGHPRRRQRRLPHHRPGARLGARKCSISPSRRSTWPTSTARR